jgi:hypothetical protein
VGFLQRLAKSSGPAAKGLHCRGRLEQTHEGENLAEQLAEEATKQAEMAEGQTRKAPSKPPPRAELRSQAQAP